MTLCDATFIVELKKKIHMKRFLKLLSAVSALFCMAGAADACTGITLVAGDGSPVMARTIEWGGSDLNSRYVIVPRGYRTSSFLPGGKRGMEFTARYGYVGLSVEQSDFVAEGLNEQGLSAGLFYFPAYGDYGTYDESMAGKSISDLQLVALVLGECATVDEVKAKVAELKVVSIDPRAQTVHWRFADASGMQVVLEIVDGGTPHFYENRLGVLTNSPDFNWHMTNLNNYVNLFPGSAPQMKLGDVDVKAFGAGSGFLGIPGDVTPPSRFVRAAFYQATAPQKKTGEETAVQCFHILNNFDIPIGIEFAKGEVPADIPSGTQWTSASDVKNKVIYFRTMYDSTIRRIDLKGINFAKVKYSSTPMDKKKEQPVKNIVVK